MSNNLDSDQNVGHDMGPNCLQRLSAEDKNHHKQGKSYQKYKSL